MKTTVVSRLLLAVVGSATLASCIFSYTGLKVLPKEEPDRTGLELCAEVQHEMRLSVQIGLLSQEDADSINSRCFQLYGDD